MQSKVYRFAALALAFLLAACGQPKPDAQAAAREFFDHLSKGEAKAAYDSATFAFQAQQSEKVFEARVKELGLLHSTVQWQPVDHTETTAKLNAEVTTEAQVKLTYIVSMQLDGGVWRVFSMKEPRDPRTGVTKNEFSMVGKVATLNDALTRPMPDDATIRQLTRASMETFADAIKQRSFTEFYNRAAAAWQAQLTERQLQRAFQSFIEKNIDLSGIASVEPVFDGPPQLTTDGLLIVQGSYPTRPLGVFFSLKFIYELPEWKLFGLDVYLRKIEESAPAAP